jgi:hypothetical protein
MPTYKVPIVITGFAVVRYPDGKGVGDYIGGLPRDAEAEVLVTAPYLGPEPMIDCTVELSGMAQQIS